uniref:transcription factor HES-7.1-like n=1 Tax=Oncorhynchus gorbuscha TaxID=8017 RepID=UPI001EAE84AD|nr:transcription factor HES-7.1-like [Oncorhynchus gorbuscha]
MKPLGEKESREIDRMLLKPQVERRRRERMNHSLESLRTLLLQGPLHQDVTQRRVEKAEILKHTVLFLQNTGDGDRKKGEDREKQHPFQDGFSGCLQRAAHFLGQEEEGLQLEAALNSTISARLNSQACMNPGKLHSDMEIPNLPSCPTDTLTKKPNPRTSQAASLCGGLGPDLAEEPELGY